MNHEDGGSRGQAPESWGKATLHLCCGSQLSNTDPGGTWEGCLRVGGQKAGPLLQPLGAASSTGTRHPFPCPGASPSQAGSTEQPRLFSSLNSHVCTAVPPLH